MIADSVRSPEDLELLARKIQGLLNHPIQLGNTEVVAGVSIGISLYPDHTQDRDELIKMADTAMYAAKTNGRQGYALYHPDMYEHVAQYITRDQELRDALVRNELRLHYQPQYDSLNGALVGLEALIRWEHPELGLLSANDIIPVAENSNLILDIGTWVIQESCRQLREWIDCGFHPPRLSLNIALRQLEDRNFAHILNHSADTNDIPISMISLEVTESCLQKCQIGLHNLRRLKKLGVQIAIDDFGTGYFSMSSLRTLPITSLKIDRCFIQNIHLNNNDRAVTNAIIAMAKQLDLRTTAIGIEGQAQAHIITGSGCDELQGYFFCIPLPADEVARLLSTAARDTQYSEWTA